MADRRWTLRVLRDETVGGLLLLGAAVIAMVWANSPWGDSYAAIGAIELPLGPLHLTVAQFTADGLLAVFFFVAGLELKHELVLGSLRRVTLAAVPVAAAIGGMVVPALLYFAVNLRAADGQPVGWGIPMATDIAFALGVLAVVGRRLPLALRAFLLTLAVVDDLGAIIVIALFYSSHFSFLWFAAAVACLAVYAVLMRRRVRTPLVYLPLVLATWICMEESGVHATIAGVALGLLTRVRPDPGEAEAPAERLQHLVQPISAGLCVPLFALFAAGIDLRGVDIAGTLSSPIAIGVIVGLVVGKPVGVTLGAWLTARFTRARLSAGITWADVATVGILAGIGFTVSLLIAELAFAQSRAHLESAKLAVLIGSLIAAALAVIAIMSRNRHYSALADADEVESAP